MDGFCGWVFGSTYRECSSGGLELLSVRVSVAESSIGRGRTFRACECALLPVLLFAGEQVSDTLALGSRWRAWIVDSKALDLSV